jgi:hypothetical protein
MLRQPGQDLGRGPVLRRLIRCADVRVQLRREGPRLRPVDDDLDEPHRLPIGPQPALGRTGARVQAGHPRLVRVTGERPHPAHTLHRRRDIVLGQTGPLREVVVIRPAPIRLNIAARPRR